MDLIVETFRAELAAFLAFLPRLLYAAVLLAVSIFAGRQASRLVTRLLMRRANLRGNQRFIEQLIIWSSGSLGALLALSVLGLQGVAASLVATGGVVAIVAGFAFREIGENFLAGFFLSFSRPFEVKDLIKTGELTGIVSGIELRHVHIRTFDACDVYVPSAQIFREPLYNYTRDGLRRPSFSIGVAYNDQPAQILTLLETAVRSVPGVLEDPASFVTIKEFGAQYVEYEVFFWIDVNTNERGLIGTRNDVKIHCWQALRDAGMTFSSDVTSGIEIQRTPELNLIVRNDKSADS